MREKERRVSEVKRGVEGWKYVVCEFANNLQHMFPSCVVQ